MNITGNQLKEWRLAKGMTRAELAVLTGYSHEAVAKTEQKGLNPIPDAWQKMLTSGESFEQVLRITFDLGTMEAGNADQ